MSKERGLGRGFDALIPTDVVDDMQSSPISESPLRDVDLNAIDPNPHQPRTVFDQAQLEQLAASIKQHGVLHPPVVSDRGNGSYELIAGERRVRASRLAGLDRIPVIVRSYDEQQKLELALLENVQRAELNPLETARAYRKLTDEFNLSLDQIATSVGQAKSTISNIIRLLQLPDFAQSALVKGEISEAHARTLLALEAASDQQELLARMKQGMTVREAEAFARARKEGSQTVSSPRRSEDHASRFEEITARLASRYSAKVRVQPKAKGGRVVIEASTDEELERLLGTLDS